MPTCVPHILYPHIGAGSKEQPLDWDEEQTDDVGGECYTHKKYWEGLKERKEGDKEEGLVIPNQI